MANLLSLKRRITAAKNVSKTTKAMQMIAASKLKRAQDATVAGRPYLEKLSGMSQNVMPKIDQKSMHEYMKKPENANKGLVIVIAPDRGLCGGLITNLLREVVAFNRQDKDNIYITVGKKVEHTVASLNKEVIASFEFGNSLPTFDMVYPIIKIVDEQFLEKRVNSVKVIYTGFTSVFTQKPQVSTLLPIELPKENPKEQSPFTLFEPTPKELLPGLLKHLLEISIYQILLESFTSEQAAKMIAMQNATDNAMEIVESLQLLYNKGRQEKITNEILDIGGASISYAN